MTISLNTEPNFNMKQTNNNLRLSIKGVKVEGLCLDSMVQIILLQNCC